MDSIPVTRSTPGYDASARQLIHIYTRVLGWPVDVTRANSTKNSLRAAGNESITTVILES
jgi:hypothetical protein